MTTEPKLEDSAEPVDPSTTDGNIQTDITDDEAAGPNHEAAKYRTRLRQTELERDGIAGRLEKYQRREAERLADGLSKPADLWLDDDGLDGLLDDDGNIDRDAVAARQAAVLEGRPGLSNKRPAPRPDPSQGARGGATTGDDWAAVLRGPARR